MKNIFTVARHTFSQCIRMKIAAAFILLLAVCLLGLPYVMKGDGTLAGSIRTFLSYSVSITGVLLSIVTVLITASVVSGDITEKHIYLIIAKPLARWEYIIGRWFGVVLLNAVLLAVAAGSIFIFSQYLREKQARNSIDRRAVETEIFTSREELKPKPPDYEKIIDRFVAKFRSEGSLKSILQSYELQKGLTAEKAQEAFFDDLEKLVKARLETAPPNGSLQWMFEGLPVSDAKAQGAGNVESVEVEKDKRRLLGISLPVWLAGRLMPGGPVTINGVSGEVLMLDKGRFLASFDTANMQRSEIVNVKEGDKVEVLADPTIQFRYKAKAGGGGGEKSIYRIIEFYSVRTEAPPTGSTEQPRLVAGRVINRVAGTGPTGAMTTVTVPAVKELSEGKLMVRYINKPSKSSVSIKSDDVSVLYRVGDFTGNFTRAILLVFCQLIFLAALAVFLGSFLSFPVGALSCMVLLMSGWILDWLADALGFGNTSFGNLDFISQLGTVVTYVVKVLMPNFSEMSPSEKLVDGINIRWLAVGSAVLWSIVIRTTFYLAVGCLIFRKRELARVQV